MAPRPPSPAFRRIGALLVPFALGFSLISPARAQDPAAFKDAEPVVTGKEPALEPEYPSPAAPVNLAITGAVITAAWYGAALGSSYLIGDQPYADELRIPVAGPFLAFPQMVECKPEETNCTTLIVVVRSVLTMLDGIGQVGGVGVLLESLFVPTATERSRPKKRASFRAAPVVGGSGVVGVSVAGEF